MIYSSFITLLPPEGSVTTRQGCLQLLGQWLAEGPSEALHETAMALAPAEYGHLRAHLDGMWADWVHHERTSKGLKASVRSLLTGG